MRTNLLSRLRRGIGHADAFVTTPHERTLSTMDLPTQVFEPHGWENPMPVLPTTMLSLKEQKRTGHLFKGCPMPLPEPDTKASNAPEACDLCARTYAVCREEGMKWHALQEADARVWKVNGIPLQANGNVEPHPGKLPTPEHVAALNKNGVAYIGPTSDEPSLPPPPPLPTLTPEPAPIPERTATEKQVALLVRLSTERRPNWVNEVGLAEVERKARTLTPAAASAAIDKLMAEPKVEPEKQGKRAAVKAGHYALPTVVEGGNTLAFYRVDVPTSGKWAGYTFVKRVVGGRPDENVPRHQAAGILARIAADPEAGPRYGQTIGQCCRCNRTLTNDESRALGIGPECITKM